MALSETMRSVLGVILQMIATFLAALAYVLQKKAHRETDAAVEAAKAEGAAKLPTVYRHRLWQIGMFLMVVVGVSDTYAFSLLTQSVLAIFGAVTLAWNIVLATLFLGEKFTRIDAASVSIITVGTITALIASNASSTTFTMQQILDRLNDDVVYAYSTIVGVLILAGIALVEVTTRKPRASWSPAQARIVGMLSPALGGMCMGFTGYGGKAVSAVVFGGEWEQWGRFPFYGYLMLTSLALCGQVRYLNTGLKFFEALLVVPIFECFIIFSNSISGVVYFGDLRAESGVRKAFYAIGMLLSLAGVSLLLQKAHPVDAAAAGALAGASKDGVTVVSGGSFSASGEKAPLIANAAEPGGTPSKVNVAVLLPGAVAHGSSGHDPA